MPALRQPLYHLAHFLLDLILSTVIWGIGAIVLFYTGRWLELSRSTNITIQIVWLVIITGVCAAVTLQVKRIRNRRASIAEAEAELSPPVHLSPREQVI